MKYQPKHLTDEGRNDLPDNYDRNMPEKEDLNLIQL